MTDDEMVCRWAHEDPYDGGLRCCNRDCEWVTEWCHGRWCDKFEAAVTTADKMSAVDWRISTAGAVRLR